MDEQRAGDGELELPPVVVRPDVLRASMWTAISALALSVAVYAASQLSSKTWPWLALAASVIITAIVASQVLAPGLWTVTVDRFGARGRVAGLHVERTFAGARAVEVTYRFGEPRLVVRGHGGRRDRHIVLLPIGADVGRLREFLARLEEEAASVGRPNPFAAEQHPTT